MTKVENFRSFTLYDRSIDLTRETYKVTNVSNVELSEREVGIIRKKAVCISCNVASALSQVNMKVRFKKLNEAKAMVKQLRLLMLECNRSNKIDNQSLEEVESCSIEVMKLLNSYFAWLSGRK